MARKNKSAVDRLFCDVNGNRKWLASAVCYDKYIFGEYKDYGDSRLYVPLNSDFEIEKSKTFIESTQPELLLNALTLIEELSDKVFQNQSEVIAWNGDNLTDKERDAVVRKITKWCMVNGYPFMDDCTSCIRQPSDIKQLFRINPVKHISFPIAKFIFYLNELGSAYYLYRVIENERESNSKIVYTSISDTWEGVHTKLVRLKELDQNKCKNLFEKKYNGISYESKISFEKSLHLDVVAHSLFDAAFYQLANFLYDNNGMELRRCAICSMYFVPKDKRQKYCDSKACYPQKAYKRRKASEKKRSGQADKPEPL